jgi:hypothetical protein
MHGQEKVQATNRKGSESYRSMKIRWGVSPVRVRVPPPALTAAPLLFFLAYGDSFVAARLLAFLKDGLLFVGKFCVLRESGQDLFNLLGIQIYAIDKRPAFPFVRGYAD